jgi:hypothetical protein
MKQQKVIQQLTTREVQDILGCSRNQIYLWMQAEKFQPVGKVGRSNLFDYEQIASFARQRASQKLAAAQRLVQRLG